MRWRTRDAGSRAGECASATGLNGKLCPRTREASTDGSTGDTSTGVAPGFGNCATDTVLKVSGGGGEVGMAGSVTLTQSGSVLTVSYGGDGGVFDTSLRFTRTSATSAILIPGQEIDGISVPCAPLEFAPSVAQLQSGSLTFNAGMLFLSVEGTDEAVDAGEDAPIQVDRPPSSSRVPVSPGSRRAASTRVRIRGPWGAPSSAPTRAWRASSTSRPPPPWPTRAWRARTRGTPRASSRSRRRRRSHRHLRERFERRGVPAVRGDDRERRGPRDREPEHAGPLQQSLDSAGHPGAERPAGDVEHAHNRRQLLWSSPSPAT